MSAPLGEFGFPVFLSHAVSRLIQQVGPRCMAAALKPGQVALRQVNSEASMRLEAINLDKTNIRRRMKALIKQRLRPAKFTDKFRSPRS